MKRLKTRAEFHYWLRRRPHGWRAGLSSVSCPLALAHPGRAFLSRTYCRIKSGGMGGGYGWLPEWMRIFIRRIDKARQPISAGLCIRILNTIKE